MKILRLAVALALFATVILATPSACPTSPNGTDLNTLNTNGGCTQVDAIFSTFGFGTGPSNAFPAPDLGDVFLYGNTAAPVTSAFLDTPGGGDTGATWSVPGDGTPGELD